MTGAYDYILTRGDLTFDQNPINEIDVFLCAAIAMPDYEGIVPGEGPEVTIEEASKKYFETHTTSVENLGVLQPEHLLPAFKEMGKKARYKDATLLAYINLIRPEEDEQFSAITIRLKKNLLVVSFRATDDTLIAWKENLDLAKMDEVPAQREAVKYLEYIAEHYEGDIVVTGHSKGGNLSIYAASKASPAVQKRICLVISFDGPGFRRHFLGYEGYLAVKERMSTVRPNHSIVGLLFAVAGGDLTIVYTEVKGPWAHDGFYWSVDGDAFVRDKGLSPLSLAMSKAMDDVVDSLSPEETSECIDIIYGALTCTGAKTLTEIKESSLFNRLKILFRLLSNRKIKALAWTFAGRVLYHRYTEE